MSIWIIQERDGFEVNILGDDELICESVRITDGNSAEPLEKIFEQLGYSTVYERM